jgi:K+-sensing histidine kinase KdpD
MEAASRVPRRHWRALYASLAGVLVAMLAGEAFWSRHADAVDIAGGLAVIAILWCWVHTNRAGIELAGAVAPDAPEAYIGLMGPTGMPRAWRHYVEAALVVAIATGAARVMSRHVDESSLAMVYLAGVVVVAARGSRGAALVACLASVGAFDFFFVPPYFTLEVAESRFLVTFAVMLVVALVISTLTRRARLEGEKAEAERVRSAVLASVSHDLRTPLTTITGAASTALEGDTRIDAVTRRELLESIRDEAERLNRLVNNLLDVTRLESGTLKLRREWIPLEELVGVALARLAKPLGDRKVTTRLPEDLPPVHVDGLLIEQVFINLLENAIKHAPSGQPIDIEARRDGTGVVVEIADRGPGLPKGEERKIFEKFFGVGSGGGAGLGLTICRAIVEAHGGRIGGENRAGGGAVFRFSLPAGDPPRPPEGTGG